MTAANLAQLTLTATFRGWLVPMSGKYAQDCAQSGEPPLPKCRVFVQTDGKSEVASGGSILLAS